MRRGYITAGHGQLHFRCNAQRPGIPLVLLHQSPSDSRMYEKLMAELDDDFWMIAPDSPGFGNSDPLPRGFSLAGCADAILSLLDHLQLSQCFLFGHHTGASVAVQMAARNPSRFRALALSGPTLLDDTLKAALPAKAAPFPEAADGSHLQSMWQRMAAKEADAPPALLLREVTAAMASGPAYAQAYAAVAEQDFAGQLQQLDMPTLVFAGTADILYHCLEPSYRLLRNGQMSEIEGAGSYVCDRQPVEVARLLRGFFGDD